MKNAYLLYNFNPYHNRQIKRFETVKEYTEAAESYYVDSKKRNFSYNDGVQTSIDVYCKDNLTVLDNQDNPDYLILTDENSPDVIDSRWFVIDSTKRCGNMYTLTLRRDLVADSYEKILDCPAYIEKATVNPADPFIFNQENVNVNKIKVGETLLKDQSDCAWVVGYMAKDALADTTITGDATVVADYTYASETAFNELTVSQYCKFIDPPAASILPTSAQSSVNKANKYRFDFAYTNENVPNSHRVITVRWKPNEPIDILDNVHGFSSESDLMDAYPGITVDYIYFKNTNIINDGIFANQVCNNINAYRESIEAQIDSYGSVSFNNSLNIYNNKIWNIGGKYYKSQVKAVGTTKITINNSLQQDVNKTTPIYTAIEAQNWTIADMNTTGKVARCGYDTRDYILEFVQISSGAISIDYKANVVGLKEVPYKMFAIPYKKTDSIELVDPDNNNSGNGISMVGDLALTLSAALSKELSGSSALYDVQLLPYCPVREVITNNGLKIPDNLHCTIVEDDNNNQIGIIYWCDSNTFTFNIEHEVAVDNVKLESITEMYRLSSPNWNGQFEFNPAKNGGIQYFNVDCTYKPFTPYIHINPNFGRLYGEDYDDARGLICAGDFSLPQLANEWQTYELQNKNYQNQFDRQIENLEFTQSVAMKKQVVAAAVGSLSGGLSGGMTGAALGGVGGAIAGAIGGTVASAIGGAADIQLQKQLNKETIDYTQDQFRMNLENIQAMPTSLKNVGGLTANNKLFPVLEHYSCTQQEKEAIALKFRYNGMTVERIGTIREFLQEEESYIKCKLIRINMLEDNHFIEALAEELNKGVFIK